MLTNAQLTSLAKKVTSTNAQLENSSGHSTETQIDSMKLMEFTRLDAHKLTTMIKIILTSTVTVISKIPTRTRLLEKEETTLALRTAIMLLVSRLMKKIAVKLKSLSSVVPHGSEHKQ